MKRYNPADIEPKWQQIWDDQQTYKAHNDSTKPKYYALSFFPYPSGIGLHIGHVRNFTITDAIARYKRMQGYEVLHPMGWDSFGLPAENYAIQTGVAPQVTTKQNTDNFRQQAKRIALSVDWSRELASTDPAYYKWTQWFFLLLLRRGLAYQKESAQFWCDKCKTVLANEQVVNGCCWRHEDTLVTKKVLKQWFFKITDYADRLQADLQNVDWPEGIKAMQRNWIGRSQGAEITFKVDGRSAEIKVFTTRADTLFGATFIVLAPEHPLAQKIATPDHVANVQMYIKQAQTKTDIDRMDDSRRKTGVPTGAHVINPINGAKIPVWVADYVLGGYGTGAIMAVPAHDERDHAFAKRFNLPITEVVAPEFGETRADEQWVDGATVIVYDESTDKFLGLDWQQGWTGLVAGGLNKGEDYQTCAKRELAEEAGITNVVEFIPLGNPVFAHYRHEIKGLNRVAKTQGFLAIVKDRQGQSASREVHETFNNNWYSFDQLDDRLRQLTGGMHWRELLRRAQTFLQVRKTGKNYDFAEFKPGEGIIINSGDYSNLPTAQAREQIVADLAKNGTGQDRVNYKIRDWLISRQRYWGAPIPVVHCQTHGIVPVPDDELPVKLPTLTNFVPAGDGKSPLARATDWVHTTCPACGGPATRETDTMDGFACSSWYFLRFADPHNSQQAFSKELAQKWLPVNMYVGGAEHAVMHLLYARMWTKVMFDEGLISFNEPFTALRNQGLLLAADGTKFSKSKGNGVDPEDIINSGYGADALRTVILFLAPYDQTTPWSPEGLGGCYRFLQRAWTIAQEVLNGEQAQTNGEQELRLTRAAHKTIKKVTQDLDTLGFNTAIAALMEFVNELYKIKTQLPPSHKNDAWRQAISALAQMLAPFAPHIAEELWHQLGNGESVHLSAWPIWDEKFVQDDTATIVVQVNGKVRGRLLMAANAVQTEVEAAAKADAHVQQFITGQPKRVVYVPGKLLNIVV